MLNKEFLLNYINWSREFTFGYKCGCLCNEIPDGNAFQSNYSLLQKY